MHQIRFFKNNKEEKIEQKSIEYFKDKLVIQKTTAESKVILDFKNQKCEYNADDMVLDIPVIEMSYNNTEGEDIFHYRLVSESEVKNTIIIK